MEQISYKILAKKKPYPRRNHIVVNGGEFDGLEFETEDIMIDSLHHGKTRKDSYVDFRVQYRVIKSNGVYDVDKLNRVVTDICNDFLRKYIESLNDTRGNSCQSFQKS